MSTHKAIDQLPSLPQVLVKILDAIHTETADFQQLADIIRHDPAIATKVINIANSSYFGRSSTCTSIERALMFLGTETVKTLVITTAIKQFFSHFNQGHSQFLSRFWRRSLVSANFAQTLATLTSYPSPDEAYLCGLLTDVGQLILLTEHGSDYLDILDDIDTDQELLIEEQQRLQQSHCDVAADLIDSWEISDFMGDAIRYHHEDLDQIQDAHHLVKIIYLSSLIATDNKVGDQQLSTSHNLFGLNESLTRELHSRISTDIDHIANGLGIALDDQQDQVHQEAHQQLGQRLSELGELSQFNQALSQVDQQQSLEQAISRSLLLTFGIEHCMLFDYQADKNVLLNRHNNQESQSALTISVQAGRSLTSDAVISKRIQHSFEQADKNNSKQAHKTLSVIDRQLIRLCRAEHLLCLPLLKTNPDNNQDQAIGVLVLGMSETQLNTMHERFGQLISLGREIAETIHKLVGRDATSDNSQHEKLQTSISEAVHEASNPLSIIRNYLETLRINLGEEHSANENINHIKEEIDRVGNILLRLKDPAQIDSSEDNTDINSLISDTANIFNESLFSTQKINLKLSLDPSIKPGRFKADHLKQVLTNLLKNACEALSPGDEVEIRSESTIKGNGDHVTAIIISDNGPGIPTEIQEKLYSPVQSTKTGNHSGLGLSIVKRLIDEMGGSINCQSYASQLQGSQSQDSQSQDSQSQVNTDDIKRKGTEFHIILP